jgi:hypothetical protein
VSQAAVFSGDTINHIIGVWSECEEKDRVPKEWYGREGGWQVTERLIETVKMAFQDAFTHGRWGSSRPAILASGSRSPVLSRRRKRRKFDGWASSSIGRRAWRTRRRGGGINLSERGTT